MSRSGTGHRPCGGPRSGAAAAPLGFSVGATPIAIGRGVVGTVGMFAVVAAILAVFAVGYVAMAGRIRLVGGLYLFVAQGLGRVLGVGTAYVAGLAYALAATGCIGAFAIFARSEFLDLLHITTPWQLWAVLATLGMAVLGLLKVELNARILGAVIACEIGILLIVSLAVTVQGGAHGLSPSGLSPHEVFGSHPGAMLAIAGFEATVIFAAEVRDPARSIGRATFGAIAVLAVIYGWVCWAVIQAFGDKGAVTGANTDPADFFFTEAQTFVGTWVVNTMEVLVVTSWFASLLAFHNAASRYLFALGRERVLPHALGSVHSRLASPWVASLTHSVFSLAVVAAFALSGRDPYLDLYILGSTPAVVALPVMELLASLAIFAFFLRNRHGLPTWKAWFRPLVATLALALATWLSPAGLQSVVLAVGAHGSPHLVPPPPRKAARLPRACASPSASPASRWRGSGRRSGGCCCGCRRRTGWGNTGGNAA
ncbi:APC family permease [Streptomyces diastatochromogenes]|uniref:APC family permease n=1 Tax=Streptomyces diastatochromogenes TaxID=42236 RepID=UPI0036C7E1C7